MIPADVASRLQISADAAQRPVAPAQEIADKLPGLVAGQKVMAEIQSLLPNGTYRALINQRSITLALPFSAKSGDALELQVTESNGKLALAVVSRQGDGAQAGASSATTLSRTGQLINNLFSGARQTQGNTTALPLNSNQPISSGPTTAQQLLPLLKQAINQSGMFYESHQAEWVEGRLAKAALLQEPQGKLSSPAAFAQNANQATTTEQQSNAALAKATLNAGAGDATALLRARADGGALPGTAESGKTLVAQPTNQPAQLIAPQTQAVVQQQLEALATQNFAWQGQIWPGQEMRWEIDEDGRRYGQTADETEGTGNWTTRLHLVLPNLGEIDARIQFQGKQISLSLSADSELTRAVMRASGLALRSQLDEAGISLASMGISAADLASSEKPDNGQTSE